MGETTNQIETHIESTREDLGANLRELERKVKSATDWRQRFQDNPMTLIGLAFGGGIFLATMMGGRKRRRYEAARDTHSMRTDGTEHQKQKAFQTWDSIKGALIGVAATRFKDFIGEIVPGFHEQFRQTENEKSRSTAVPS